MRVRSHWNTKSASKTKICELKLALAIYEEILRLQVAVQYSMEMTVSYTMQQLVQEPLDNRRFEAFLIMVQIFLQVLVKKFEDQG